MGIDIFDDFSDPVRGDIDFELSVFRAIEKAGDQIWARPADERPQRWLRNQDTPPIAAYLSSGEQWSVAIVARAGIQVLGYFDDYIWMESVEWAEGILQKLDIGECPAQLSVDFTCLESGTGSSWSIHWSA